MRKLRSQLTFANVASAIALFVALSTGGAYAFNEWTGANIVDESLTGADVRGKAQTSSAAAVNGSLTGYDISGQPSIPALGQPFIDGSLTTWDINDATLIGPDVKDGSLTTSDIFDGTLQGRDVQNNSLTGEDINESTLAPVPSANPNADTLDGIDSTGFTRPACTSQTGAVKGFARINTGGPGFPTSFSTAGVETAYNCSGGTVEARRTGQGQYEVRFNGTGPILALAGASQIDWAPPDTVFVNVSWVSGTPRGERVFRVHVTNVYYQPPGEVDQPFVIVLV